MKILALLLALFALSECTTLAPLKYQGDVVSVPARIIGIKQAQRGDTSRTSLGGGLWTNYRAYTANVYVLKVANHEDAKVDGPSSLEIGQCVTLYVRARSVGDTRFFAATGRFPATGEIEADDNARISRPPPALKGRPSVRGFATALGRPLA